MAQNGISRRDFVKSLALGGLAAGLGLGSGCATIANLGYEGKWNPKFWCGYLQDESSPLRIVYVPDIHSNRLQNRVISFIDRYMDPRNVRALALEGLSGVIDDKKMAEIRIGKEAFNAVNVKYRPMFTLIRDGEISAEDAAEVAHAGAFRDLCAMTNLPHSAKLSPGGHFALYFNGRVPLFGFEDERLFNETVELVALRTTFEGYKAYEKIKDQSRWVYDRLKEEWHTDEFAKAGIKMKEDFNIDPDNKKVYNKVYGWLLDERSKVAVENIAEKYKSGEVWMIMGKDHTREIIEQCSRDKISLAIPGFTLINKKV